MRRILLITTLCLLAVASTGCKKARLRVQLKELMGSTIVLPEKVSCVYNGEVYPMPDSVRHNSKLLVFVDSTECSKCRISRFVRYDKAFGLAEKSNAFEVVLLLSTPPQEYEEIVDHLCDIELFCPVYLDDENAFAGLNPALANSNLPKSVYLDQSNEVLFVGDPSVGEKVFSLLVRTITEEESYLSINY